MSENDKGVIITEHNHQLHKFHSWDDVNVWTNALPTGEKVFIYVVSKIASAVVN